MNVIYLSYDGMTDPLGQSQVLPYIIGLSKKEFSFTLISCEKKERFISGNKAIEKICNENNIDWQPIFYTKRPPVLSTLWDIYKLNKKVKQLYLQKQFSIIHCRSYITALIGLGFKTKYNTKFLFDMRGFWADERIDGNIWDIKKLHYKWIYNFFKKKEKAFLTQSNYTVSLTHNGKKEITNWKLNNLSPIEVIPCCTDTKLFNKKEIERNQLNTLRKKLNLSEQDNIISYLGSIGTWYMLEEMLDFFAVFFDQHPNNKALFITKDDPNMILKAVIEKKIDPNRIIITPSERQEVPLHLKLCFASVFFIKPLFSKKASSATKMGEIMNLGIPVICNDIGDNTFILKDVCPQLMIKEFNTTEYLRALTTLEKENNTLFQDKITEKAKKYFSLENGIDKYYHIYKTITQAEV